MDVGGSGVARARAANHLGPGLPDVPEHEVSQDCRAVRSLRGGQLSEALPGLLVKTEPLDRRLGRVRHDWRLRIRRVAVTSMVANLPGVATPCAIGVATPEVRGEISFSGVSACAAACSVAATWMWAWLRRPLVHPPYLTDRVRDESTLSKEEERGQPGLNVAHTFRNTLFWRWAREMPRPLGDGFLKTLQALGTGANVACCNRRYWAWRHQ